MKYDGKTRFDTPVPPHRRAYNNPVLRPGQGRADSPSSRLRTIKTTAGLKGPAHS